MIDPVLIKLLLTSPSKIELLVTKALLESRRRSWKLAPTNGKSSVEDKQVVEEPRMNLYALITYQLIERMHLRDVKVLIPREY